MNYSPIATSTLPRFWSEYSSDPVKNRQISLRRQFLFCLAATFIDGLGTIIHLGRGAWEANPVWVGMIDQFGAIPAMGLRMVIGVLLLSVLFTLWQRPLARVGMGIMVAAFIPLTLYHLFLLMYLPMIA